jgi:hypothetical protein
MGEEEVNGCAAPEDRTDSFLVKLRRAGEPRFEKDRPFAIQKVDCGPGKPQAVKSVLDKTRLCRERRNLREYCVLVLFEYNRIGHGRTRVL